MFHSCFSFLAKPGKKGFNDDPPISFHHCNPTATPLVIFLFLLSSSKLGIHAAGNTIKPGDSISINQTIHSPAGTFVLGFFNPGKSPTSHYLGIWFSVDDKAVVWVANREKPLEDTSGALTLDAHGNLVILNRSSGIVWSSNSSAASNGTEAALSDSGNLVLRLGGDAIWQSFDHPTNTFLPDMEITLYYKTGVFPRCVSWRAANDPSPGAFSSGYDPRTLIQGFLLKGSEPYYRTRVMNDTNIFAELVNEESSGGIYIESFTLDDEKVSWRFTVSQDLGPSRLVLEETGFLTLFSWNAISHHWIMQRIIPRTESSPCELYSQCGSNAVCAGNQPTRSCKCLTGFVPKNLTAWDAMEFSSGCVRNAAIDCSKGAQYVAYTGMKVPDGMTLLVDATEKECEANCSAKCNCTAYSFVDTKSPGSKTRCLVWFGEMADLVQNFTYNDQLFVRVDASDLNHYSVNEGSSSKLVRSLVIILPIESTLILFFVTTCCLRTMRHSQMWKYKRNVIRLGESTTSDTSGIEIGFSDVTLLDFHTIRRATDDFALVNKLGEGGFGSVYKGRLEDGQNIAVKRLSENSRQGFDEFRNEVELIAKLQHTNLVKLFGWCLHRKERILIYEYMSNKSLDKYLFDSDQSMKLDWSMRFKIIQDIAQGLLYLHRYSRVRIIHRDLKTSNILLDESMNPKISDFGLARIFEETQLEAQTQRVIGTYGYMAPEYGFRGHFSEKSDIFSFGVIVLEIISGKRNANSYSLNGSFNLLGYVWQLWAQERCVEIADPAMNCLFPISEVVKSVQVGLLCVQDLAKNRPTMESVMAMLGNKDSALPSPRQPTFTLEDVVTMATEEPANELTMSTFEAR